MENQKSGSPLGPEEKNPRGPGVVNHGPLLDKVLEIESQCQDFFLRLKMDIIKTDAMFHEIMVIAQQGRANLTPLGKVTVGLNLGTVYGGGGDGSKKEEKGEGLPRPMGARG